MTHTTTTTLRLRLNALCLAVVLNRAAAWFVKKKSTTTTKNTKTIWSTSVQMFAAHAHHVA
jgi:hypothetical protein